MNQLTQRAIERTEARKTDRQNVIIAAVCGVIMGTLLALFI